MGEVKYGREFRLSNGETEYIELFQNVENNYEVGSAINRLKADVYKHHCDTEISLARERNSDLLDKAKKTKEDFLHTIFSLSGFML